MGAGFPFEKVLTVHKTRTDRKDGTFEVELGGVFVGDPIVKLKFPSQSVASTLASSVLIAATDNAAIAAWRDASYTALAKKALSGPLSQLPPERQRSFMAALRGSGSSKVSIEAYKDKSYVAADVGAGEYVFNTLQMNQNARVARRTSEVLSTLKSLYAAIGPCPEGIAGIKLTYAASYKNFLREYEQGVDAIQAYFPCDLIGKFQNADITNQALVNGSVILVGGDRVDVSLSQ
jgi:hypothetical protein